MNTLADRVANRLPEDAQVAPVMPALPKSLLTLGAGILTARTAAKLKRKRAAVPAQEKALQSLLRQQSTTAQGRQYHLTPDTSYTQYARQVPLHRYEDYLPAIESMKRGEADVLWPGRCRFYAVSSGTTADRTKYLPITEGMLQHFRRAGLASLFYYTARVGHAGMFRGRHLFLGGSTTLTRLPDTADFEAYSGDLSGITALNLPAWADRHLYEPGTAISQMADWPAKIEAIAARTKQLDITLLAGIPSWLLILAESILRHGGKGKFKPTNLQAVWPNLECIVHGGVPIGPFTSELRRVCGSEVNFHEVYPASEGFIAAQDGESAQGLRLIVDAGIHYEFLPLGDYDENLFDQLGSKAVPLAGVRAGVDYVLIMSTPAGLCRYIIGDVVRFISTEPPRLMYVGRTKLQLSAFGEHVIEKELTDALLTVCQRHGWTIGNFHVAPIFMNSLTGQARGRHEWWIELKSGTVVTPTGPMMEAELDVELQRLNDDYEGKRKGGGLDPPTVRLVMPGVFENWMRHAGKWGGQSKMPRCRSDRQVADELAQMARFTSD